MKFNKSKQNAKFKYVHYLVKNNMIKYCNDRDDEKLNEFSEFRIGSLTKLFTCIILLKLQENKIISLNDKIDQYIKLRNIPKNTTINKIMNHKSGLIRNAINRSKHEFKKYNSATELFNTYKSENLFTLEPNKYSYSNVGYQILGYIIEKSSGNLYMDLVKEFILKPLKLNNTDMGRTNITLYNNINNKINTKEYYHIFYAYSAGGLSSCINDLIAIFNNLNKILKNKSINQFKKMYFFKDNNNVLEHGGNIIGGSCKLLLKYNNDKIISGRILLKASDFSIVHYKE